MLSTLIRPRTSHQVLVRVLAIFIFAVATGLAARFSINQPFTSVPIGAEGWRQGMAPFIGVDLAQAIIASGLAESTRLGSQPLDRGWM